MILEKLLTLSDPACYGPGGAIMAPPRFFSFWATKSPKLNLGTFLALNQPEKPLWTFLCFLQLSRQRLKKINGYYSRKVKNFKEFEYLQCNAREMKVKNIELSKIGFDSKKNFFSIFWERNTKIGCLKPGNCRKEQSQKVWFRWL